MTTEHRFISFDRTPIFYRLAQKDNPLKAILVIVHGMGEHGGRYKTLADYLSGLGFLCLIPDLRGFGKSGGRRAYIRHISDHHKDLQALFAWIRRQHKDLPIFFIGHSFGGLTTATYLAFSSGPKPKGLVLISPIFGIGYPVPRIRHALGLLAAKIFPYYSQATRVNTECLTHDREMMEQYEKDALIYHRITASLYAELSRCMSQRQEIARRIDAPVLLLQSGDDRIVSKEKSLLFYEELHTLDKKLKIYDGWYHEILNETGRSDVFQEIAQWLIGHLE